MQNLPFTALGLSVADMHKQFEPMASMSALSSPVSSLLDSVSAFSATGLTGVDMISDMQRQAKQIHADLMEEVRRATTPPFLPSMFLPKPVNWLDYLDA